MFCFSKLFGFICQKTVDTGDDKEKQPSSPRISPETITSITLHHSHCNNKRIAIPSGSPGVDPGHQIRPNNTFHTKYDLARYLTVEKSMVRFKVRHNVVQYMPAEKIASMGCKTVRFDWVWHWLY